MRLWRIRPNLLRGVWGNAPQFPNLKVLAHVTLTNDGKVAWPTGSRLCNLGGNSSLKIGLSCMHKWWSPQAACGRVPPGRTVEIQLSVPIPRKDVAEQTHGSGWLESRVALCEGLSGKPFGVLFSVFFDFRTLD
ncbi:unnamed protein product [Symbiodinium sp. KB8]|nr:unnamed protein product [Symbiodinium sp. KB8]